MPKLTRNDVTFVKELIAVQTVEWNGLRDVVRQINWRMVAVWNRPGGYVWRAKKYVHTDIDFPVDNFTVYPDLTKETILSWLNLSAEQQREYEDIALQELNNQVNPVEPEEDRTQWVSKTWL